MSEPRLLNLIELETRWGYRTFELHEGNIVEFRRPVDLLAVSALSHDLRVLAVHPEVYARVANTVIGALFAHAGLDVALLGGGCQFDLRAAFGCWVSQPTSSPLFRRVLCVEDIGLERSIQEAIDNVFVVVSMLESKSIDVRTLLLPMLGAGGLKLDPEPVMRALLDSALRHLTRFPNLERIFFVELDPGKAASFDQAMNDVLGRIKVPVPKGELVEGIRRDILRRVEVAVGLVADPGCLILADLRRIVANEESRSFEIGIVARRLVEFVVQDFGPGRKGRGLAGGIDDLADHGVADWMRSYMHVLRIFGNESAHERGQPGRRPPSLDGADLALCLGCVLRVLDFWVTVKRLR